MIHKNIENTLIRQNIHWKFPRNKIEYINRDLADKIKLNSGFIEIVTGVRRSGKSTIFNILIDFLIQKKKAKAKEILFINFDNPNFVPLYEKVSDLDEIIKKAEVITGYKIKYLFLDEVQNISLWEKWVKASYDQKDFKKIFITGSNSDLLEGDYISRLSGRYFSYINFPFSFKEFLRQKKQDFSDNYLDIFQERHKIIGLFDQYLKTGGFPEVVIDNDLDIVNSYYQTILLKDVIANNKIRDVVSLKELSYYLLTNCTSFFSYNKLARNLNLNERTVLEYVDYLKASYLFFDLKKYDYSLKKQNINKKKIYSIDNAMISQIGFNFSENNGKFLENLVAVELLRQNKEIYYHKNNHECDFVVKEKTKIVEAIQVCYEINERNRQRELDGLLDAMQNYKLNKGIVITRDQKDEFVFEKKKIKLVPAWEWLLGL